MAEKLTPVQIKERRVRAATENRDAVAKRLEKAEAKLADAEALKAKVSEAREELAAAQEHLDWVSSMPVRGETPAQETVPGTEDQDDAAGTEQDETPEA